MKGNLIRLAVTAALLTLIVRRVDWAEFARIGSEARVDLIVAAYLLNLAMVFVNAWRWQILVRALGTVVGMVRLLEYYFVCMFFNNFMPTSIGGDVMRVIDLSRETGKKSSAMASILVERLLGLYCLFPVGLGAFLLLYPALPERNLFLAAMAGMGILFVAGTVAIRRSTVRRLAPLVRPFGKWLDRYRLREKGGRLYDFLDLYRGRKGAVLAALLLSLISRLVWIYACWIFGRAIGLDLPPAVYFLLMPLVEIGRMLPISLAGMGIREGIFVVVLALFGVGATSAVFNSVLVYAVFIVNGMLGGIVYGMRGFLTGRRAHGSG